MAYKKQTRSMKNGARSKANYQSQTSTVDPLASEFAIGYLYRDIEIRINEFAASTGGVLSAAGIAGRLGTLLCSKARGQVLGAESPVFVLRGSAPQNGEAVESLALGGGARSGVQGEPPEYPVKKKRFSPAALKHIAAAQRKRWREQKADTWGEIKSILSHGPSKATDIAEKLGKHPATIYLQFQNHKDEVTRDKGSRAFSLKAAA